MELYHPAGMYNQLPPEDVFHAADKMGNLMGTGYVVHQYQPHVYPDCPINIYFHLECQPAARYMLLGALVSRANQLRASNPGLNACVYTNIDPRDLRAKSFYEHSGMDCSQAENLMRLSMPAEAIRIPMSCQVVQTPLNTPDEHAALLYRLQQNDIAYIDQGYLAQLQHMPHFVTLSILRNTELVGEVILAGEGDRCDLAAIYITPMCRCQGMGRALLYHGMAMMAAEGVTSVNARIMSRSLPQNGLIRHFNPQPLGQTMLYPGRAI